jgi:hypothetical protein
MDLAELSALHGALTQVIGASQRALEQPAVGTAS